MPCGALSFLPTSPSHPAPDASPALFDDTSCDWMDYGTVRAHIDRIAPLFAAQTRGLVFCCVPRSIDGVIAYLSAATSGNAVAMIDPSLPRLQETVAAYQPEWIVASAENSFSSYQECGNPLTSLKLWKRKNTNADSLHPDFYLLFLTSGSTGSPKAVRLSYANLAQNTAAIISSLGLTAATRTVLPLPLSYSFGLSVLHMQLAVGGSCLLSERGLMSREFWQSVRDEKATLFPGVPYHYDMLNRLGLERLNVPLLRTFLQAGGKMHTDKAQDFLQQIRPREGDLFLMYGQTETSPRMSCLPLHAFPEKSATVGRALDGGTFDIQDGEIFYSGANVMLGYAEKRADLALGDEAHGRLATGDIGSIDPDGFLTIFARKQRFAKLFGQRIALDDLENCVRNIAPVVAIESEEKIILVTTSTEESVCERLKKTVLSETKIPATSLDVQQITAFPLHPNGKIDYLKVRDRL